MDAQPHRAAGVRRYVVALRADRGSHPFVVSSALLPSNPYLVLAVLADGAAGGARTAAETETAPGGKYHIPNVKILRFDTLLDLREHLKMKIYNGYFDAQQVPLAHIQADNQGILSFSRGEDSKLMGETVHDCFAAAGYPAPTVTDAGAGCGSDSMQFLLAFRKSVKLFGRVTSVEIDSGREAMLQNNLQTVWTYLSGKKAQQPGFVADAAASYRTIRADYTTMLGDPQQALTQDIVFLDPPWGETPDRKHARKELQLSGWGVDAIVNDLILKNQALSDADKTKMVVLKTPSKWNTTMFHALEKTAGILLTTRLPQISSHNYWMFVLDARLVPYFETTKYGKVEGFLTWRLHEAYLKQFFPVLFDSQHQFGTAQKPLFLQHFWRNADDNNRDGPKPDSALFDDKNWDTECTKNYVAGQHHENLHNGEKKLLESSLYTILFGIHRVRQQMDKFRMDQHKARTKFNKANKKPIEALNDTEMGEWRTLTAQIQRKIQEIQSMNLWIDGLAKMQRDLNGEIAKQATNADYKPDQAYDDLDRNLTDNKARRHTLLHEVQTLQNRKAMITQQHTKQLPSTQWAEVLENTIVLYIGAAGLNKDTHHFNELMQAIPKVHFACYDIRKIETEVPEQHRERITKFQKIFTRTDLENWIRFSKKFPNKSIIVLSDIRSDWHQAKVEIDATKNVTVHKMKVLHSMDYDSADPRVLSEIAQLKTEIQELMSQNRAMASWIDDLVEFDNYVQWTWASMLEKYCRSFVMFSAKCREPYQTDAQSNHNYFHFVGAEVLQSPTNKSTETRTQITCNAYKYWEQERHTFRRYISAKMSIAYHFKTFGDLESFNNLHVDYTRDYQKSTEPAAMWYMTGTRNKLIHDKKFAWYNDVEQAAVKQAAEQAITVMYETWQAEFNQEDPEVQVSFNLAQWCRSMHTKITSQYMPPKHEDTELVDEMLQKNEANVRMLLDHHAQANVDFGDQQQAKLDVAHKWFDTSSVLRRYETYLRRDNIRIWDLSQEGVEALIVLNMNMRQARSATAAAIDDFEYFHAQMFEHPERAYTHVKDPHRRSMLIRNARKSIPRLWIVSQLRFNICNPFAADLYASKERELSRRYDEVHEYMAAVVNGPAAPGQSPLRYRVGSCEDAVARAFVESKMRLYHARIEVPRDWYCYWLRTLLEEAADMSMRASITKEQIRAAIGGVFVEFLDAASGHVIKRKDPGAPAERILHLESWPQGKPVLYYACEKGCLAMLEFCLLGVDAANTARKINTARKKMAQGRYLGPDEPQAAQEQREAAAQKDAAEDVAHFDESVAHGVDEPAGREHEASHAAKMQRALALKRQVLQFRKMELQNYSYPLHAAVYAGNLDVVRFLVAHGADPAARNWWNETAQTCAADAVLEFHDSPERAERVRACGAFLGTRPASPAARARPPTPCPRGGREARPVLIKFAALADLRPS